MGDPLSAMNDHSGTTKGRIRAKVRMIDADEALFGVLSSGERIAVALVLDRYDLLQRAWGTIAESIRRLVPEWTEAALRLQRNGWYPRPPIGPHTSSSDISPQDSYEPT